MSFSKTLKRYFAALWPFGKKNVKPPTRRNDTSVPERSPMISGSSSKLPPCSEVDNGTGDDNLPLSVITVLSNDDLLMAILLRLPVVSLHLFKSVSKHWLSLITSQNFTLTLNQIPNVDPCLGFFTLRDYSCYAGETFIYDFVSFDIRIPSKRSVIVTLGSEAPPNSVEIKQSCNGLFLCSVKQHNSNLFKYYVYNPTTKLFKMLPIESSTRGVKMAFDPTKSPHYKVIHVRPGHSNQIETYCSQTGHLSVCGDRFHGDYFNRFEDGIYWNDAIHWLESGYHWLENYRWSLHCKLEIVNEHVILTKLQLPVTFDGKLHVHFKLFESRGSLLLLYMDDIGSRHLTTFEMRNGYSEWSVKYIVNLNDLSMPFSGIWRIWTIVLGEKDEDSFFIIDLSSKVVHYNPVLKTVSDLKFGVSLTVPNSHRFQFIASFAGV